jgi:hypothetical protein
MYNAAPHASPSGGTKSNHAPAVQASESAHTGTGPHKSLGRGMLRSYLAAATDPDRHINAHQLRGFVMSARAMLQSSSAEALLTELTMPSSDLRRGAHGVDDPAMIANEHSGGDEHPGLVLLQLINKMPVSRKAGSDPNTLSLQRVVLPLLHLLSDPSLVDTPLRKL